MAAAVPERTRRRPPAAPARVPLEPNTLVHFGAWASQLLVFDRYGGRTPFVVEPWQLAVLRDYFDGVVESLLLLPKGNGKTTILTVLALYHLCHRVEADAYVAAASRDQAAQLYRYGARIIRANPGLEARLHVQKGYKRISNPGLGGELQVLAADANTIDGTGGSLVLIDELHRHRDGSVYQTLRDGLIKVGGQLFAISTAGWDPLSVLGLLVGQALRHLVLEQDAYRYARTPDGQFAAHLYGLLDHHDADDMRDVLLANPLSTIAHDTLQALHDSPSMSRRDWLRYRCNVWVQTDAAAIPREEWAGCADPAGAVIPPDAHGVWVGMDLGWVRDTTAIVAVWRAPDGRLVVETPTVLVPPGEGVYLSSAVVRRAVENTIRRHGGSDRGCRVVFDPAASGQQLAEDLERDLSVEVLRQPQHATPMADALSRLTEAIRDRRLVHPGDPTLDEHVYYATAKPVRGTDFSRLDKGPGGHPNDAAIALAMAVRQASPDPEPELVPFAFSLTN